MRTLLGIAFVVITSVAAFTYRDLLLGRRPSVQRASTPPAQPVIQPRIDPIVSVEGPSIAELHVLDSVSTALILAVQSDPLDVRSMTELAFLYMKQGWFDRAIGPLARAREIDATSEPLRRYLELAVARSSSDVDLYQEARNFEEMVLMEGHGC